MESAGGEDVEGVVGKRELALILREWQWVR